MGPGDDDLRALARLAHLDYVGLQPGVVLVVLEGDLLGLRQQGLDLAQVEQGVAVVALLDDAGDDVAFAAGVLLVLEVALRFADALEDDLLGGLGSDPPEVLWRVVPLAHDVAFFVQLLAVDTDLARVRLDRDNGFFCRARHALVSGHERVGQSVQQKVDADPLFFGDLLQGVQEREGVLHRAAFEACAGTLEACARTLEACARPFLAGWSPHSKTALARSTERNGTRSSAAAPAGSGLGVLEPQDDRLRARGQQGPAQPACPMHRLGRLHGHPLADVAGKVLWATQPALKAGARHLEQVVTVGHEVVALVEDVGDGLAES